MPAAIVRAALALRLSGIARGGSGGGIAAAGSALAKAGGQREAIAGQLVHLLQQAVTTVVIRDAVPSGEPFALLFWGFAGHSASARAGGRPRFGWP